MNKNVSFLVIEKESRGEVVDIKEVYSDKKVEDFCNELLKENSVYLDKEYVDEFCNVGKFGNVWEVCLGEERSYDVYELK